MQILARDKVRSGHVEVAGLDIVSADERAQTDRPQGFGVYVLQGAFSHVEHAGRRQGGDQRAVVGLSAGRPAAPVLGICILVSGVGFEGRVSAKQVH